MLTKDKILSLPELMKRLRFYRGIGNRIVFTNGVFDILHRGHLAVFEEAKKHYYHFVVVGINSDASTRRLKGAGRPIVDERSRAMVIAALVNVDAVVIFNEDTPLELIEAIQPDILLKGGDYTAEDIVGYGVAGTTRTVPVEEGFSVSSLIERIQK